MRRLILTFFTGFIGLCAAAPAASAHAPYPYAQAGADCSGLAFGQPVQVFWGSAWWEATVVRVAGPSTLVHYVGWSNAWDEWVAPSRLRAVVPRAQVPAYEEPYVWSVPRNTPWDTVDSGHIDGRWHRVRGARGYRTRYSR